MRVLICAIFLSVICQLGTAEAQVNIITTFAGTGVAGYSGDGGPASDAKMNCPYALCIDHHSNLLFCDGFNHAIRKISLLTHMITTIAGNGSAGFQGDGSPATGAQFTAPSDICIDFADNIYITDAGNNRIRKTDHTSGLISTIVGTGTSGALGDGGLAISAQLNAPLGLCIDSCNLYIADYGNNKIRKVDLSSNIILTIAGDGTSGYSGDHGLATNCKMDGPAFLFGDSDGNIFVSDLWNSVIRKIDATTKVITTVVGNGTAGYGGDNGPATSAQLMEPAGIFIDTDKNIFIADYRNGAIRKVTAANGKITTVAGGQVGYGGGRRPCHGCQTKMYRCMHRCQWQYLHC